MQMPSRTYNTTDYRFGYNGMEKDKEIKGDGNSYTTEFRQYDPRLGRWLSLDPLMAQYSEWSPYVAFENNPVVYDDPLGLSVDGEKGKDNGGDDKVYKDSYKSADRWIRKNTRQGNILPGATKETDKDGNTIVHYTKVGKAYINGEESCTFIIDKSKTFKQEKRTKTWIWETDTRHDITEAPINRMIPGDKVRQKSYDPYRVDYTNGALPDYREYLYLGEGQFVLTKKFRNEESVELLVEGLLFALPVGRVFKVVGGAIKLMRLIKIGKGVSVIGPRATYRQFAKSIGARFLKVTDAGWTWKKNLKFLEGVVKRGDDVIFAGEFNPALLDKSSVLAKEIEFLKANGYEWVDDFSRMVKQ